MTVVKDGHNTVQKVIPIAGDLSGKTTDPKITLLSHKKTPSDEEPVQGVRVVITGGSYSDEEQFASIDFLCDRSIDQGKPRFISYREGTLSLEWKTTHACYDASSTDPDEGSGDDMEDDSTRWGFLTWFLIVVFLLIGAYIIFAGFFNYSRYGASNAWDIIPHSDTLRDLPFLFKDFIAGIVNTIKGGGGIRAGYNAV